MIFFKNIIIICKIRFKIFIVIDRVIICETIRNIFRIILSILIISDFYRFYIRFVKKTFFKIINFNVIKKTFFLLLLSRYNKFHDLQNF